MTRINTIIVPVLILLVCACTQNRYGEMRKYYRGQMQERIRELRVMGSRDTVTARQVQAKIEEIVLVSKDKENPQAARHMASLLFDELCYRHDLPREDFPDLAPDLTIEERELQLRENALALVDRLIMADTSSRGRIFTAH